MRSVKNVNINYFTTTLRVTFTNRPTTSSLTINHHHCSPVDLAKSNAIVAQAKPLRDFSLLGNGTPIVFFINLSGRIKNKNTY